MAKKEIACSINPACGNAAFAGHDAHRRAVKVAVVGGGPAGMEAARIATERGHFVTLYEKSGELGGAMKYVCLVPGKEKMRWYLDWIRDQLLDLHVDIRLNHAPTVGELTDYDVVLNATGAESYVPPVAGDASRVIPFEEAMACPKVACECHPGGRRLRKLGEKSARIVLWGDHYAAVDTAAFLANIGKRVTIVTENKEFARGRRSHPHVRAAQALRAGRRGGPARRGRIRSRSRSSPRTTVVEIRDGEVVLQDKDFNRTTLAVDEIVTCHTRPVLGLFEELRAAGVNVINVGRLGRSRATSIHAVKEGAAFGLAVDEQLLFNPNGAILNDVPIDVLAQLTREEGPSYTALRMAELMAADPPVANQ